MTAESKPRYWTPCVTVDAEVSLSEFDMEKIVGYLRHHGYTVTGGKSVHVEDGFDEEITPADLDYVFTLAVAGQPDAAKQEALRLIGNAIGRPLQ
jgi:hypothetical protein